MKDESAPPPSVIGQTLRNRRLQRGLAVEQVAQDTRIQARFLRAMEEEKWGELPARVYLQGFLRQYATHLGLDGEDLLKQFLKSGEEADKPHFTGPGPVPDRAPASPLFSPGGLWPVMAVAAGLLGAGLYFSHVQESRSDRSRSPSAHDALPPPAPPAPPAKRVHEIAVSVQKSQWVRVWVDDRVRFEGFLQPGRTQTWPAESKLRLQGGTPSSMTVLVDGQPLASASGGPPNEIHWTAEPLSAAPAADYSAPAPVPEAPAVPVPTSKPPVRRPRPKSASNPPAVTDPLPAPQSSADRDQ